MPSNMNGMNSMDTMHAMNRTTNPTIGAVHKSSNQQGMALPRRAFQDRSNAVSRNPTNGGKPSISKTAKTSKKSHSSSTSSQTGQQIIFRTRPPFQNINKFTIPQLPHVPGPMSKPFNGVRFNHLPDRNLVPSSSPLPRSLSSSSLTLSPLPTASSDTVLLVPNKRDGSSALVKGIPLKSNATLKASAQRGAFATKDAGKVRGSLHIHDDFASDTQSAHSTEHKPNIASCGEVCIDLRKAAKGSRLHQWLQTKKDQRAVADRMAPGQESSNASLLRCTNARFQDMVEMESLVLGDGATNGRCTSTTFWFHIIRTFDQFKRRYAGIQDPSIQLAILFGFCHCIYINDSWISNHGRGWGGDAMIATLARYWKKLLSNHTPLAVGLDLQTSYPTVLKFLHHFKMKVERKDMYGDPPLRFDYG